MKEDEHWETVQTLNIHVTFTCWT